MNNTNPTQQDLQLTAEIRDFFEANEIKYVEPDFGLFILNDGMLEVRYVNSYNYRIDCSKRFGGEGSGVSKNYFAKISKEKKEQGIRVIWVFDFEMQQMNPGTTYRRQWEVLKNYIRTATGHIQYRFNARDCEVREVDNKELRPFLDTNCFYGYRSASKNMGLYLKKDKFGFKAGTLLMVYTFGYNFYGNKKRQDDPFIEIIRVATVIGCQVIGGASKLLRNFLRENETIEMGKKVYPINELRYYCDASHNAGNSLESMGFKFLEWKDGGFMNILTEDLNEVYTRPQDGNKVAIKGKKGDVQQRKPMAHKRIMELMAEGKIISVGNAGTSVYCTTREEYLAPKEGEAAAE